MTAPAVVRLSGNDVCIRCFARLTRTSSRQTLYRSSIHTRRKLHGGKTRWKQADQNLPVTAQGFINNYFSANNSLDRGWIRNGLLAAFRTAAETPQTSESQNRASNSNKEMKEKPDPSIEDNSVENQKEERSLEDADVKLQSTNVGPSIPEQTEETLPHRRRRRKNITGESNNASDSDQSLPLDASSQLTTAATSLPSSATLRRKLATYLSLSKPRLSFLILLTTTSAYSLYPIPEILSSTTSSVDTATTLSTSTLTFLFLTTGTFLSCACANSLNMLFEPKYDAMMTRTRNRPLVRNLISRRGAALFAVLTGGVGLLLLDVGTNPTVAALSALNIFLYAGVYTPMKRLSPWNTWVGAIVGGIPPLMGWCAAAGEAATSEHHSWKDLLLSESSVGGWLVAALLFAWQFPHFMSLSHTIRDDYRNAGHKMLAWVNPARNARVALRYSLAMFPICAGLYWAGIVNPGFLVLSTACNAWMTKEAIRFWRKQGAAGSARGLFWASVWQLPLVLVGALVCKTGIWDGFFQTKEPVSIYDETEEDELRDGQTLGMALRDHNRNNGNHAMMGFKRPS